MIDYINFGEVVNVNTYLTSASDNVGSHVIIDFLADDSVNFDRVQNDISKLLKRPKNYILCDIEDVIEARREFANLKKRVEELEDQLAKESDKVTRLKDAAIYWNNRFTSVMTDFGKILGSNGVEFSVKDIDSDGNWNITIDIPELNKMKYENEQLNQRVKNLECINKFRDFENSELKKELKDLKSKTIAEVRFEWKPDCFTAIYTMCDGSKQTTGIDFSESVDATSISCGTVPKCSSCAHYMHNPSRFTHDWCHKPVSKEGPGCIRKLSTEEAEGPACSDFKARKE